MQVSHHVSVNLSTRPNAKHSIDKLRSHLLSYPYDHDESILWSVCVCVCVCVCGNVCVTSQVTV